MRSFLQPGGILSLAAILSLAPAMTGYAAPQKTEYLSEAEADKIREAGETGRASRCLRHRFGPHQETEI